MRVFLQSKLACSRDRAWHHVRRSSTLQAVAAPLLRMKPNGVDEFPAQWRQGESIGCRLWLCGIVPLGKHVIHFEQIDKQQYRLQTRETSRLVQRWEGVAGCARAS